MKQKSIIYLLLFSFTFGFSLSSCEDMLDVQSERHSYETAQDTLYAYWGILKTLQTVGERYVLLGELRGDLVMANRYDGEVSDSLAAIANFTSLNDGDCRYLQARDYYAIINNCNAYIASADTTRIVYGGSSNNSKYMLREYAQVEAIRAWTYLQLVQLYREVPFYLQPLTSTSAIEDFINNPGHQVANANNLPDLIGSRLLPLIAKEDVGDLSYPDYGMYQGMAHSSMCYFPLHLVMGDIYLNANRYAEAADQYYTWMAKDKFKAVPSTGSNYARPSRGFNQIEYNVLGYSCFDSDGLTQRSASSEAITVIPGTTNKLWGNVLRGVNEAFGWTTDISVSTSNMGGDSASVSSSVKLEPKTVKRQFIASDEFARLTKHYPALSLDNDKKVEMPDVAYDYFTTSGTDPDTARDARYGWYGKAYSLTTGGNYTRDSLFITKQNPGGAFSTTYPVIYRRALVWLRFAEAINRAGYPEYAYAVLRDGLYSGIIPTKSNCSVKLFDATPVTCLRHRYEVTPTETADESGEDEGGEEATEPVYDYMLVMLPMGTTEDTYADFQHQMQTAFPEYIEDLEVILPNFDPENDSIVTFAYTQNAEPEAYQNIVRMSDDRFFMSDSLICLAVSAKTYLTEEAPRLVNGLRYGSTSYRLTSGNYIPVNRILSASSVKWLDFEKPNFEVSTNGDRLGIHQRGNGYIAKTYCDDDFYNFDKCIQDKWPEYDGPLNYYTASPADYATYEQNLISAVEELIIDELALECCFEGNRYNDLVRFSTRDGRGAKWLQEKINKRGGAPVTITESNMYLKLPVR